MDKRKALKIGLYGLLGLALFLIILNFDLEIARFVNSFRNPLLDSIMLIVVKISTPVIVLIPAFFAFRKKKLRNWTISLLAAYLITLSIKLIVGRLRPFELGLNTMPGLIESKYSKWDFSFPSNHASTSLASFFFIPQGFRWAWAVISVIMMFSRIYFGLHYLSDLMAGALIGIGISYVMSKYADRFIEIKFLDRLKYRKAKK